MNKNDLEYLLDYNGWANRRILSAASKLTPEQFTTDLRSSHGSVRDTLTHIVAAEWMWLERWNGTSPAGLLKPDEFTFESLATRFEGVGKDYQSFLEGIGEDAID